MTKLGKDDEDVLIFSSLSCPSDILLPFVSSKYISSKLLERSVTSDDAMRASKASNVTEGRCCSEWTSVLKHFEFLRQEHWNLTASFLVRASFWCHCCRVFLPRQKTVFSFRCTCKRHETVYVCVLLTSWSTNASVKRWPFSPRNICQRQLFSHLEQRKTDGIKT